MDRFFPEMPVCVMKSDEREEDERKKYKRKKEQKIKREGEFWAK